MRRPFVVCRELWSGCGVDKARISDLGIPEIVRSGLALSLDPPGLVITVPIVESKALLMMDGSGMYPVGVSDP